MSKMLNLILKTLVTYFILYEILLSFNGLGFYAQKFCVDTLDTYLSSSDIHKKIICSFESIENSKNLRLNFLFTELGLLHILVTSGSHVVVLQRIINFTLPRLGLKKTLTPFIIFILVVVSNFNPPVTRSFLQFYLAELFSNKSRYISNLNLIFMTALIYLALRPEHFNSLSLWLSICASFIVHLFRKNPFGMSLGLYFCLLPFLIDLNPPHLTAPLINILFTPLLSIYFVWSSLLILIFPQLNYFEDHFINLILNVLENFYFENLRLPMKLHKLNYNLKILYGISFSIFVIQFQKFKTSTLKRKLI